MTQPVAPSSPSTSAPRASLSNVQIADRLRALAQLLSTQKENPYKLRAYRRAADAIAALPESVSELVRTDADLTTIPGVGKAIASAIREIAGSGTLQKIERLRAAVPPEMAALTEFPALDPRRVQQVYRKLGISTVAELREKLESGEIAARMGARLDQHVRRALTDTREMLLDDADEVARGVVSYLESDRHVRRVEIAGEVRRRGEVVRTITALIETDDFDAVVKRFENFGGHADPLQRDETSAWFRLPVGIVAAIETCSRLDWGVGLVQATGSEAHLEKLEARSGPLARLPKQANATLTTERGVYRELGLALIPPELREGRDEIEQAAAGRLPRLVTVDDICGELHAHTTGSDGAHSIEQMVEAARERGYTYLGISDHSQSLKIAGGVSVDDLWRQIRRIDRLNAKLRGFRILKSAECDILADGTLDYPDDLLRELDYTVCSIHSRFALNREQQTARVLRAMENPYFTILGHATGRLLLRRAGYELDFDRVIAQARDRGCFFEINASPDRLDLSAENARRVVEAGVKIAVCTDAHSTGELDYIRCGIDQARRAGLTREDVLNCRPWPQLAKLFSDAKR